MINLQQLDSLEPLEAIEIDKAVLDLKMKLKTNLAWLPFTYGRAYRINRQGEDKRLILPEVYVSNTEGKYTLMPVTPDNDKKGSSFFVIDKEKYLSWAPNQVNYLTYNVGLVVWVNLEMINGTLAKNEDFTQQLIKQTRDVITNKLIGTGYKVEIVEVVREPGDIFREFNLGDKRYVVMPFSAFRFNLIITLKEDCQLPLDRESALLNNITQQEKCTIIIPSLNFAGADFDCLTEQQKTDLLDRLTT